MPIIVESFNIRTIIFIWNIAPTSCKQTAITGLDNVLGNLEKKLNLNKEQREQKKSGLSGSLRLPEISSLDIDYGYNSDRQ